MRINRFNAQEVRECKERVAEIIQEYDQQGIHRTGTEVDSVNAQWLSRRIKELGLQPNLKGFDFKRLQIQEASVTIKDNNFEGVPLYDSITEDEVIIKGNLGSLSNKATIGVVRTGNYFSLLKKREKKVNKAMIIVPKIKKPGIAPLNAENYLNPFPPPILQLSSQDWHLISKGLKSKLETTFKLRTKKTKVKAFNVTAVLEGENQNLAPLIIMTPRSGWWNCASERGGGIACVLEIMRALSLINLKRKVIFTFNTGHELGHLGLNVFLNKNDFLVKRKSIWLHLGANFAASRDSIDDSENIPKVIIQTSDTDLERTGIKFMKLTDASLDLTTPNNSPPQGEAKNINQVGNRYFSLIGTNPRFHYPVDRWPDAINIDKTERIIEAMILFAKALCI